MKIAVLLRGQLRYNRVGAEFFKKYVRDRFPHHEFKIFYATWPTVSNTMDRSSDNRISREFNLRVLDKDTILNELKFWNPMLTVLNIIPERELLDLTLEIRNLRLNLTRENKKYWNDIYIKKPNAHFMLSPYEGGDSIVHLMETIRTHYLLGQMYGLGKSYELLKTYSNETNWVPDIVWATRPDFIGWFDDEIDFFENMHIQLSAGRDNGNNNIIVDGLDGLIGRPVVADYNFYTDFLTADKTFGNTRNLIISMFNDVNKLFPAIGADMYLQHALWTSLFSEDDIRWTKNNYSLGLTEMTILRPVDGIDEAIEAALNSQVEKKTLENLKKHIESSFVYPNPLDAPPVDAVLSTYHLLLTN